MSNEELLQPRYKVIADWPDAARTSSLVGHIYQWIENLHSPVKDWCKHYDPYPYLFKKLKWWEERELNNLPEYVKETEDGYEYVYKVIKHVPYHDVCLLDDGRYINYCYLKPATEQEYNAYQSQQTQPT